ncbi:MAG: ABC transporter permease subunit [Oscillospiraceae bacterium]|jgi:putative aldouronate transport system permease protein|nr:ABC transporter permease subunit [Oscillospiraceae bacterium]
MDPYKLSTYKKSNLLMLIFRMFLALAFLTAFVPEINPARLSELMNRNASLFTSALSYSTIGERFIRALNQGWIEQAPLTIAYIGAIVTMLAIVLIAAAFCMSLGNTKLRRLCLMFSTGAGLLGVIGIVILFVAQGMFENASNPARIQPLFPVGIWVFGLVFALTIVLSIAMRFALPKRLPEAEIRINDPTSITGYFYVTKAQEDDTYNLAPKYRLFLMLLPFLVFVVLFSYLPLWGWRFAFFNYEAGFALTRDNFVGWQWFSVLVNNPAIRSNIVRVMTNTFALSGIGIATSWLPIMFAVFLSELRSNPFKRTVQTLTTIPNYISWVLVFSVAFAIFSTNGFFNWMLITLGIQEEGTNFLMDGNNMWIKMWAWGTWKGLGWGAIIYLASISSIDPQLYEAAMVDGAGRYKKMWHITVPGLLPTYFVLLLLSIANILSNGLEQYLVFENHATRSQIDVLDLYIFNLGLGTSSNIPVATLIGMLKSVISVVLLFSANRISKWVRGETII